MDQQAIEGMRKACDLLPRSHGRHDQRLTARQTRLFQALKAVFDVGRDRTTASHACRVIEDLRDNHGFDALLHAMEAFVMHPGSPIGRARQ